jgi:aspartate ammonia-lyase
MCSRNYSQQRSLPEYGKTQHRNCNRLNPYIGYKQSTQIAKEALETGKSVYNLVLEKGILSQEKLDEILDPKNMLKPHNK